MITIYTTSWCPFCGLAMRFFNEKRVEYEEIDIEAHGISRNDLARVTGGHSVPQIVIDGEPIGGYDDLMTLEADGKLALEKYSHKGLRNFSH